MPSFSFRMVKPIPPRPADRTAVALALILLLGAALRFIGLDWDQGFLLHPDERFITMTAAAVHWPRTIGEYFDVRSAPLSPYRTKDYRNYIYGTLPLFATKALAAVTRNSGLSNLARTGRKLSALLDLGSTYLVFLVGSRLFRHAALPAVLAALLYALCVTAIQHAHFFTCESWLVFFILLTFYLASFLPGALRDGKHRWWGLSLAVGTCLGFTVACKLNGLFGLLPVSLALLPWPAHLGWRDLTRRGLAFALILLSAYLAFRLVSPYIFTHSSWFRLELDPHFKAALNLQRQAMRGDFLFPPAYQWLLSTPIITPLRNLFLWGYGPALALTALFGFGALIVLPARSWFVAKSDDGRTISGRVTMMLLSFTLVVFFYGASQFVHSIRYLLPLAPLACLAAAVAVALLRPINLRLFRAIAIAVPVLTFFWAVAFVSIYTRPHTRIAASRWIYDNVPRDVPVLGEYWDDPLPVPLGETRYQTIAMKVFDPDDAQKLAHLHRALSAGGYYVLSSPRAWKTIGRLPAHFPLMVRFYRLLIEGRLGYEPVARFASYPQLGPLTFNDLSAEESFWVYDHPPVTILRKERNLTRDEFQALFADLAMKNQVPAAR